MGKRKKEENPISVSLRKIKNLEEETLMLQPSTVSIIGLDFSNCKVTLDAVDFLVQNGTILNPTKS